MNPTLVAIFATLALATAGPVDLGSVSLVQDTVGNYNLKYITEEASRDEQGFADGKVVGTFTYKDTDGGVHTVKYVAGADHGFTAEGDLPRPVQETPEVAAVRAAHLAVVEKERSILPPLREETEFVRFAAPAPPAIAFHTAPQHVIHHIEVDNTAELEAAKAEHLRAHQAALTRLAEEYAVASRRTVF